MNRRLLILLILFLPTALWAANDCLPPRPDTLKWRTVQYVVRGDLITADNINIVLEGVVSPHPGRPNKWYQRQDEPLAKQAKLFLLKLFANHDMKVGIDYDTVKADRFLREVGHLYYRDKQGQIHSVQQALLKAGLALAATNPPNLKHQQCYYAAEKQARTHGMGIWGVAKKYPALHYPIIPSKDITAQDTGYRIIKGPVKRIVPIHGFEAVNLDTTGIRIPEKDFKRYWKRRDLQALQGKTIEVRGRPYYYKGHMYMIVRHPWSIDRLNPVYGTGRSDQLIK